MAQNKRNQRNQRQNKNQPKQTREELIEEWKPKTSIGLKVKSGEIKEIDEILDSGQKILEAQIVDVLIPNLETDLLLIGQSKGKFGGGQRRAFRQTQKKTEEGNRISFETCGVVGNNNGYVGVGFGKARETIPAREKSFRIAKLNIMKVRSGCGSWRCGCGTPHSIPFAIEGKCGSSIIKLLPAPKGTGLCVEKECQKILALAGIKDVWCKTRGHSATKTNLIKACVDALGKLSKIRVQEKLEKELSITEGKQKKVEQNE